tara:strand:- start:309 stop:575 length:267 start_codon:yes stop_codon:yes gene_type:complete
MKRTKGIGPNNLGVSKAAAKKAYGDGITKKIGMGAESYGGAMANKSDYGDSGTMTKFNPALEKAAIDGKLNPGFEKAVMDNKKKKEES